MHNVSSEYKIVNTVKLGGLLKLKAKRNLINRDPEESTTDSSLRKFWLSEIEVSSPIETDNHFSVGLKTGEDLNSLPPDGAVTLFPADTDREDNINEWIGLVKSKKVIDPGRYIKVQSKLEGWIAIYPYTTEDFPEPKNCDRFCRDRMCDETDLVAGYPVELEEVNRRRLSIKREIWERRLDDEVRRLAVEYLEAIASARTAVEQPIQEARREPGNRERAYAQAALAGCQAEVAKAEPGGRNNLLNTVAYRMGRMVARGWVEVGEVERALWAACDANGLLKEDGGKQCRDSINSGLTAGQGKPHDDLADHKAPARLITLDDVRVGSTAGAFVGKSNSEPRSYPFTLFRDIPTNIYKSWILDGWLGAGELSVFFGAPKSGKSVLVGDVDCHIAAGMSFHGKRVAQGAVLYVAAERRRLVERRLAAFRLHHEIEDIPLAVIGGVFNLCSSEADARAIVETGIRLAEETGFPLLKVTIDTAAQVLSGGDENSGKDMGAFVHNLQIIQTGTGAHVSVVHHTPHYDPLRMRGHGSFLAAADTTVIVAKEGTFRRATVSVANDGAEGDSIAFGLLGVDLGSNPDTGEITTAPVVVPIESPPKGEAPGKKPKKLTAVQEIVLRALREAITELGEDAPASNHVPPKTKITTIDRWRDYAYRRGVSPSEEPRARQIAFKRAVEALTAAQRVSVWDQFVWPIS